MSNESHAPGLKRMKRHNGRMDLYWVADPRWVKRGFLPKTQRLFGDWNNPTDQAAIASRCRILQAEMLEWAAGVDAPKNTAEPHTVRWLCRAFETDEDSPYHALRRDTCIFYSRYIKALIATAGHIYLSKITGRDVRRWHAEWTEKMGARSAYGCVQTLRRVIHYGCELRDRDAIELAQVLSKTRFSAPRGRKKRPTYEQIKAFRQAAHKAGRASIALAITLQFDLHLRQKDVIGEWTSRGQGLEGWEWGLTWSHIDAANILRKPTSKSNGQEVAEHDLKLYPDVLAELPERGLGPIVVDEHTGLPWSAAHFRRQCKKIAKAAGWPEGLWNMDARAGAISEALDAGADLFDVMSAATHTQLTTTRGYNRERVEQTSRVARLRLEKRHKPGTDEP